MSSTQLAEVWERWWTHELRRGGVTGHKYEEYKGFRFYDGDYALVVDVRFHRVEEDVSGWLPCKITDEDQEGALWTVDWWDESQEVCYMSSARGGS